MSEIITIFDNAGRGSPLSGGPIIGEDTEELLESIEKAFDVRFTVDDVVPETVGKLCELVRSRLKGSRTRKCMSSITFYALRRAIIQVTGTSRKSVSPSAELAKLLTKKGRRNGWKAIWEHLALPLQPLVFSSGVDACLSLVFFAFAAGVIVFVWPMPTLSIADRLGICGLTCFGAFVLWAITRADLQPLATQFPRNCQSVGDLVKLTVARNYGKLAQRAGGWDDKELWGALRNFIADEISVDADTIKPDTPFPEGLGIF